MKPETETVIIENTKEITGGFLVPANDSHISAWQIESDRLDHDRHLHDYVAGKLKLGDCMLDLGAYDGDSCFQPSKIVGPDGLIMAVEAGSLAFSCLKHNVELFETRNVFPIHAAISEHCGESSSHIENVNLGASVVNVVPRESLVKGEKYLLTITIDYLMNLSKRKINFIKLDIEGFEVKALIGGSKCLQNDKPKMLIEVNEVALKNQGSSPEELMEALLYFGYHWEIVQPEAKVGDAQFDIFCEANPESKIIRP